MFAWLRVISAPDQEKRGTPVVCAARAGVPSRVRRARSTGRALAEPSTCPDSLPRQELCGMQTTILVLQVRKLRHRDPRSPTGKRRAERELGPRLSAPNRASGPSQSFSANGREARLPRPPSQLAREAPHPITWPRRWMGFSTGAGRGEGTGRWLDSWRGFPRFQGMERFTSSGKNSPFCGRGREQGVSPAWSVSKYIVLLLIASPIPLLEVLTTDCSQNNTQHSPPRPLATAESPGNPRVPQAGM